MTVGSPKALAASGDAPKVFLLLAALLTGGIVILWTATRWGIGLSPDSTVYLAGARGLIEGQGVAFPFGGGRWYPITSWPPFYSIVLALGGALRLDLWNFARALNAVLLGANAVVVALLVRRMVGGGTGLPLLGGVLFLLSADALSAHGWAWSDPLFLFLGYLGLLVLDGYLETGSTRQLVAAGVLLGLCSYTRYAGIAFALTGVIAMTIRAARRPLVKSRVGNLLLFAALALLPLAAWLIRNAALSVSPGGDIVTMRGIPPGDWQAVYEIVSLWFLPGRIPEPARSLMMAGLFATFLVLSLVALRAGSQETPARSARLGKLILLFILVYLAILVATRVSFRAFNIRDSRYYLPIYAALVVMWLYDLRWLHRRLVQQRAAAGDANTRTPLGRFLPFGWAAVFIAIVSFHTVQAAKWARESYGEGLGYANASWHSSGIVDYIRALPEDTPILSNAFDAIFVLTGREVFPFPRTGESPIPTGLTSQEEWAQTYGLLRDRRTLVAAFRRGTRKGQVDVKQILRVVPLCPVREMPEGVIYALCDA